MKSLSDSRWFKRHRSKRSFIWDLFQAPVSIRYRWSRWYRWHPGCNSTTMSPHLSSRKQVLLNGPKSQHNQCLVSTRTTCWVPVFFCSHLIWSLFHLPHVHLYLHFLHCFGRRQMMGCAKHRNKHLPCYLGGLKPGCHDNRSIKPQLNMFCLMNGCTIPNWECISI